MDIFERQSFIKDDQYRSVAQIDKIVFDSTCLLSEPSGYTFIKGEHIIIAYVEWF